MIESKFLDKNKKLNSNNKYMNELFGISIGKSNQPSNSKHTDVRPSDRWACTRNTWTAATRFEESIPLGRQTKNIIIIIEDEKNELILKIRR